MLAQFVSGIAPLRLRKWDLKNQVWLDESIAMQTVYRCSLAQVMHPKQVKNLCLLDGSSYAIPLDSSRNKAIADLATALKENLPDGYALEGATGSRKQGYFQAISGKSIAARYLLSQSKRISHLSILYSECRAFTKLSGFKMLVLDDADYTNQVGYGIGDCHGVMSENLANTMAESVGHHTQLSVRSSIQFRIGMSNRWIAKGTILPVADYAMPTYEGEVVDLVLPKSSFKGNCPVVGKAFDVKANNPIFFGIFKTSKLSSFKSSHTVTGWFQSPSSVAYLSELASGRMAELLELRGDVKGLVKAFISNRAVDLDTDNLDELAHWKYAWILHRDTHNQLLYHPKTRDWANQAMRTMVLDTALGGFLRPTGAMAAPLPQLKPGIVFSHDIAPGEYIFWRYPIRHYGDILKVTVINPMTTEDLTPYFEGEAEVSTAYISELCSKSYQGVFWINPEYFLTIGGDFDGDYACFLSATDNPLAAEIDTWNPIAEIAKPQKSNLSGSFEEIAANSVGNQVGLVASLITGCRILGFTEHYAKLGQQLQIVVDSYKSGLLPDYEYISSISRLVNGVFTANYKKLDKEVWLRNYKDRDNFLGEVVYSDYRDTISTLWNDTCDAWKGTDEDEVSPFSSLPMYEFAHLFHWVEELPDAYINKAREVKISYGAQMQLILQPKLEAMKLGLTFSRTQEAVLSAQIRSLFEHYESVVKPLSDEQKLYLAAAFHQIWYTKNFKKAESRCSLLFSMFPAQYAQALQHICIKKFRLWKHTPEKAPSDFGEVFYPEAQEFLTTVDAAENGLYLIDKESGKRIGRIIDCATNKASAVPSPGMTLTVSIHSVKSATNGEYSYHQCEVIEDRELPLKDEYERYLQQENSYSSEYTESEMC